MPKPQLQLLHDLRQAQERHELLLYYQPKFSALDGAMIGAEALVRWNHPPAVSFLLAISSPSLRKPGFIFQIGEWVLHEACRQMSAWRDAGHTDWTISVNLSALQFNHPGLIDMVHAVLARHSLEPRYLTLEITESTAMRDADTSLVILEQLHEIVCASPSTILERDTPASCISSGCPPVS